LIGAVLLLAWLVAFEGQAFVARLETVGAGAWSIGIAAGAFQLVGAYALTRGLTIGPISLVMPIVSSYGAVSAGLAIAHGEAITLIAFIGIVVTMAGVGLASIAETTQDQAGGKGVPWALLAALGYGVTFWAQGQYVVGPFGGLGAVLLFLVTGVAIMSAAALVGLGDLRPPPRSAAAVTFGCGALAVAAYVAVAQGFATGQIAIVAVLSTLSSVVTAILGYVVLGERLTRVQLVGVAVIMVGVVLINLG